MFSELGNFFLALALGFVGVQVGSSLWGVHLSSWSTSIGVILASSPVIPAQAGIQKILRKLVFFGHLLDPRLRGDDTRGGRNRERRWLALGRVAAFLQGGFMAAAFLTLIGAFFFCDFSLLSVALHDHTQLPWYYRLAAAWGNHEGALLLFVVILSSVSVFFAIFLPHALIRGRALVFQGLLTLLFLALLLVTSNPFAALPLALPEGQSLNPLLQDRGLLMHPPLLYMGYVGFSAPFSLALGALWEGEKGQEWSVLVRPWVLFAWGALTAGIALGSWWAYYELGWGGWWFWDPVENVSLMPWLAGTALLHTLRTNKLYRWSLFLSLLSFGLSLLGTFLVRSGLITSVHSFVSDPERGIFILSLIGGIMGFAFFMWLWRAPRLQSAPLSFFSREGALFLNSLFLSVGLATLVLGTLYPLWSEFMEQGTIAIGTPYFERTFVPLMLPLLILIPIGSLLRGKEEPLLSLLMAPLTATLGAATLILYVFYPVSLLALIGLTLGVWIMSGTLVAFFKKRLSLGASLAHIGVAISLLGVSGGGGFRSDKAQILGPQESMKIGRASLTFLEVQQGQEPTYLYEKAILTYPGGVLTPEKRLYKPQDSLLSETAIGTNGIRDLYVTLGPYQGEGRWLIRASFIPLAPWIWIGGALMVLGAGVSFCRRNVIAREAKQPSPLLDKILVFWVASSLAFLAMTIEGTSLRADQEDSLSKRAQALAQEVRCPVCLGQSVAESDRSEAETLKAFILEHLQKGESEEVIREHLRQLYGPEILFRPPFEYNTLFLWVAPFGLFLCVMGEVIRRGLSKR